MIEGAFARSLAVTGLDLSSEIIVRTPCLDIAEFQGTRAALEAEGIIPAGTKWPDGFDDLRWEDDTRHYWLRRERPEGIKGPRKQFLDVDWWALRFEPKHMKPFDARHVECKKKELTDLLYRQSPKGQAEWREQWNAYWKAVNDGKYQAFKALIPGINRPKRGRRPKITEQSQRAEE